MATLKDAMESAPPCASADTEAACWRKHRTAPAREYHGGFANFMVQMRQASEAHARSWQRLLDEGYVEVVPGHLRHPDTGVEVLNG